MHDLVALQNRIKKTQRLRVKWAKRVDTEAYRIYDEDIPEHPYIIDLYKDQVLVYDRSEPTDLALPDNSKEVAVAVAEALGFKLEQVHLKLRRRMAGTSQYEKLGTRGVELVIREESTRYLVNLSDYLDTGLFLDHRPMRHLCRGMAPGLRLLNLFCYTASISVAAATAGVITTNIDLSNTYLEWAEKNFRLNDLPPEEHRFVREDALKFLAQGPGAGVKYDVIFFDPPTFSNSKKMEKTLDIQRDHKPLIEQAMAFLKPGGTLYFSTNRRRFAMDEELALAYFIEDISAETIPEDFRDRKIHRCFTLTARSATGPGRAKKS